MSVDRIGEDDLPIDTVVVDNYAAGREAAEHVLDLGHADIVIAASVAALRPIAERIRGISDACRVRIGVEPRVIDAWPDIEAGAARFESWLARNRHPTAVIAMTNVTTLAALTVFARARIDIPGAVSLVGFDDYAWMTARKVPLSAVRQPIVGIAPDEGCTLIWCGDCYDIPYRSLLLRNVGNLIVAGRAISTTHEAMGAIRVMATCMAMGEAAGRAAALAVSKGIRPHEVDVHALRRELLAHGAYLRGMMGERLTPGTEAVVIPG